MTAEIGTLSLNLVRLRSIGLRLVDQQRLSVANGTAHLAVWRRVSLLSRRDDLGIRGAEIRRGIRRRLDARTFDLRVLEARLHELDPVAVLGRGFSLVVDERGVPITSIRQTRPGSRIGAHLNDGTIHADVVAIRPEAN